MNRIDNLFISKKKNILSVYFTAGHPELNSTIEIIQTLADEGVDMIEIGIPFSDPVADGPIIQQSSHQALENGMNLKTLFEQIKSVRDSVDIPLILMGYLNPVMQYGIEAFCTSCRETGIDGTIIPDLPLDIYLEQYESTFKKHNIYTIFMATPQTSDERYKQLDKYSKGFLYMVAASATTGMRDRFEDYQNDYFRRIQNLNLKLPRMIGFGISSHATFTHACEYASGAIIGSAFVNCLNNKGDIKNNIRMFIKSIVKH